VLLTSHTNQGRLLTHEEQIVWKLVRENGSLWKGRFVGNPPEWTWQIKEDSMIWDRLREYWSVFRDVANGTKPPTDLPRWQKVQKVQSKPPSDDDEIPF
jgi:hypothetical protein